MLNTFLTFLQQKKQLTKDTFLFKFKLKEPKEINFKPGQYLILKINDKSRLYSIASPDYSKKSFELVVEIVVDGLGSEYLKNLRIGDQTIFQGPSGLFTIKKTIRPKIFLATGTGIAPIRSMIKSELKNNSFKQDIKSIRQILKKDKTGLAKQKIIFSDLNNSDLSTIPNLRFSLYLLWGLRTKQELYFFDEFRKISKKNKNFQFKIFLSQEKNQKVLDKNYLVRGRITDGVIELFSKLSISNTQSLNYFDYYLCGAKETVFYLSDFLRKKGIKKDQIFFERFN